MHDATSFADETARLMREYYEANKPRGWFGSRIPHTADNLMLGLSFIADRRRDEWQRLKNADAVNRLKRIKADFNTTRLTHQYSIRPDDLTFLLELTENKQ